MHAGLLDAMLNLGFGNIYVLLSYTLISCHALWHKVDEFKHNLASTQKQNSYAQ